MSDAVRSARHAEAYNTIAKINGVSVYSCHEMGDTLHITFTAAPAGTAIGARVRKFLVKLPLDVTNVQWEKELDEAFSGVLAIIFSEEGVV